MSNRFEELSSLVLEQTGSLLVVILTLEGEQSEEALDYWVPESKAYSGYVVGRSASRDVKWEITTEGYKDAPINIAEVINK